MKSRYTGRASGAAKVRACALYEFFGRGKPVTLTLYRNWAASEESQANEIWVRDDSVPGRVTDAAAGSLGKGPYLLQYV